MKCLSLLLLLCFLSSSIISAINLPFNQTYDHIGENRRNKLKIIEINIPSCNELPCGIRKGTPLNAIINITLDYRTRDIKNFDYGLIRVYFLEYDHIEEFDLTQSVVCKKETFGGGSCWMTSGRVYSYYLTLNVPKEKKPEDGKDNLRDVYWRVSFNSSGRNPFESSFEGEAKSRLRFYE